MIARGLCAVPSPSCPLRPICGGDPTNDPLQVRSRNLKQLPEDSSFLFETPFNQGTAANRPSAAFHWAADAQAARLVLNEILRQVGEETQLWASGQACIH